MKQTRGVWQGGRIVGNDVAVPRAPLRFVVATVVAVLLVDLVLALALAAPDPNAFATLDSADDVRTVLERATGAKDPWLLVGDSVLAGDVMEGHVEDWQTERVIDHMRREGAPGNEATFHQVALNGLLPVDIERIVTELDRTDPAARVSLVVEINPRYWSRHYAAQRECTRDWLCDLGVPLLRRGRLDWEGWATTATSAVARWSLNHLPIVRHRDALGLEVRPEDALVPIPASEAPPDPLAALARLTEHYRGSDMRRQSKQVRALRRVVARLRRAGRRAVFFTTPIEDKFQAAAISAADYGDVIGALSRIIDSADDPSIALLNLDHPSFTSPLFIDHCHLLPDGNRHLAVNLLHELNFGLGRTPARAEMVHPEGVDSTLLARIARGDSDGASWQAQLNRPRGIAVQPNGRRVVIADTGNNALRELRGNMQTVRRVAGAPPPADGETADPRHGDGKATQVTLRGPKAPWFYNDRLYFSDAKGRLLRFLIGDRIRTDYCTEGPRWERVEQIRSTKDALYLLDNSRRILRFDPVAHRTTELVTVSERLTIHAFDVTEEGRIFVSDSEGRIWETDAGQSALLGDTPRDATLLFANVANETLPERIRAFFPFRFDEIRLHKIRDIRYVDRYGGLLVQDEVPTKKKAPEITERIHLRFLDLANERVYPWLRPLTFGGGHILANKKAGSPVTRFHVGSMALDQRTASLFYLERERSRLVRMGDGLMGAALIGNTNTKKVFKGSREYFATATGDAVLANFEPDRHLDSRWERLPRKGPYTGLLVGSSMIGISDMVGMYSVGRALERRLQDALGYRDRTRFDLFVRSSPAASAKKLAELVERFVESSAVPDVILVEIRATGGFFKASKDDAELVAQLQRVRDAAERAGALLVLLDVTSLVSTRRDGLRQGVEEFEQRIQLIRDSGLLIVDPGDLLLDDHWLVSPWGSPPVWFHHISPWAVDAAADRFAAQLYPFIREHLHNSEPARHRELPERSTAEALVPTFEEFDTDWDALLPSVPAGEMQRSDANGRIELYVDIANLDAELPLPQAALACVYSALTRDPISGAATEVKIRLARFSSYDEYGQGVLEGAEVRFDRALDKDGLRALIAEVLSP